MNGELLHSIYFENGLNYREFYMTLLAVVYLPALRDKKSHVVSTGY